MKLALILISLVLITGCSNNSDVSINPKHQWCSSDSDCVEFIHCDLCTPGTPINSKYIDVYNGAQNCEEYSGGVCEVLGDPYTLSCVDGFCSIVYE